jgi:hypothetical protein
MKYDSFAFLVSFDDGREFWCQSQSNARYFAVQECAGSKWSIRHHVRGEYVTVDSSISK